MKLRFYARPDNRVTRPGSRLPGRAVGYVGLQHGADGYSAKDEPDEFDSDTPAGRRLLSLMRREHSLWPSDKATADKCGVAFVDVAKDSRGEWRPKQPAKADDPKPADASAKKKAS